MIKEAQQEFNTISWIKVLILDWSEWADGDSVAERTIWFSDHKEHNTIIIKHSIPAVITSATLDMNNRQIQAQE